MLKLIVCLEKFILKSLKIVHFTAKITTNFQNYFKCVFNTSIAFNRVATNF